MKETLNQCNLLLEDRWYKIEDDDRKSSFIAMGGEVDKNDKFVMTCHAKGNYDLLALMFLEVFNRHPRLLDTIIAKRDDYLALEGLSELRKAKTDDDEKNV